MIITYPDQITHKAIIKTLKEYLDSAIATGRFICPRIVLESGSDLLIILEPHEIDNPGNSAVLDKFGEFVNSFKSRILENLDF